MTLATSRIVFQGETPYAHEREAIEFAIQNLPNNDPYHLWALLELLDPSTGRLYEIDLLVLGYSALYLVEVKSGPGRYEGDHQDWYRTDPEDDRPRYMENPHRLTNHKAKVLASRLRAKLKDDASMPWVEPLIFLSNENVELRLSSYGDTGVVTRDTFLKAVTHHDFPGATHRNNRRRISTPAVKDIARALDALGLRARKGKAFAGSYELGEVLADGPGYQDRLATHRDHAAFTRRARIYLVPQQTSVERRQQLRRAADREAQLLWDVRDHKNVLRIADYLTDAPLGPTVLFDAFDGARPLDAFLRNEPDLPFLDRVTLVAQIGRALAHCHRKEIVHGALSPEAVLVRRDPEDDTIDVRLFNFQLGLGTEVEATTHWSALASEQWSVYQAPELREDPSARTSVSDIFSLGALAYYVFTGQPPGTDAADVDRRLRDQRHLDPRAADDGIHEKLADLIAGATCVSPVQRYDDAEAWVELLIEELTAPTVEPTEPELDPLEARRGDPLGDDLLVDGVLGQGATARVLLVQRVSDTRSYALKVALSTDHDDRLRQEADVIASLHHARIVQLVDRCTFGGRSCLLLSLAGTETLHKHLAREGTVSLDLASRYGDDLLSALEHLEERLVMHRDIKPANLGVGSLSKGAAHLTLFDFSLAHAPKNVVDIGTSVYRDPFLRFRGEWDYAAERWSAAVTLHEMLTGVRPSYGEPGSSAIDTEADLRLAAERFDPSVRDVLVAFFERALARELEQRFASTKDMRHAWIAALEAPSRVAVTASTPQPESEHPEPEAALTDEQLAAITPDTLIEALPLPPRARNALDRAGLVRAADLLDLADNRLSAIRGIGTRVAQEILEFRNRWREALPRTPVEPTPFFPGYRGDDLLVHAGGLAEPVATALRDAGLNSLASVALAPAHQIEAIAERNEVDANAVRAVLDHENRRANERAHPSTLEGWIEALLPKRKKRLKHPRLLYGIEGAFAGQLGTTVKELAKAEGVTTAAIYIAIGKAREDWGQHGALSELRAHVHRVVDAAGGALPLEQAADRLLTLLPHDRKAPAPSLRAQASALVRIVTELERDDAAGLHYIRLHDATPWICATRAHARALEALGIAADELAARPVLASPSEASRILMEAAEGSPLASLPAQRLAELAALASQSAARSARLEIYPRGMTRDRALHLSAPMLRGDLSPEEVIQRVASRYPEAEPLPPRPELDQLLAPHGLTWDADTARYSRPGETSSLSNQTRAAYTPRVPTALPSEALSMEPDAVAARQFDERLRNALERRTFRVLGVHADRAAVAARAIAQRIGTEPVAFDKLLVTAVRAEMQKGGIKREDIIHAADREGRHGKSWPNLLRLVEAAASHVADQLLPPQKPLLLIQPGLIARYRLEAFLTRLMQTSKSPDAAAIFLLVPSYDAGGIPRINGELAIPGLLASQALWVSLEWLNNKHNAAA